MTLLPRYEPGITSCCCPRSSCLPLSSMCPHCHPPYCHTCPLCTQDLPVKPRTLSALLCMPASCLLLNIWWDRQGSAYLQASQKSAATVASAGNAFGSSRRLTTMACHTGGRMPSMTRLHPVRAMAPQTMLPAPRTPAIRASAPHMPHCHASCSSYQLRIAMSFMQALLLVCGQ